MRQFNPLKYIRRLWGITPDGWKAIKLKDGGWIPVYKTPDGGSDRDNRLPDAEGVIVINVDRQTGYYSPLKTGGWVFREHIHTWKQ